MQRNKAIKLTIRVVLSLVLLAVLVASVPLGEVWDALRGAAPAWVAVSFLLALPGILVSARKWQILLHAQEIRNVPFLRLWRLYHVGIFFSNFLPTEMGGDLVRTYDVGRSSGKLAKTMAATTVERATALAAVVLFAVLGVSLNLPLSRRLGLTWIGIGSLVALLVGMYVVLNERLARWIKSRLAVGFLRKLFEKIESFYRAILLYKSDPWLLTRAMGLSVVNQVVSITIVHALVLSMGLPCTYRQQILVVPMILLIGLVPITLNSIGLREGAFVFLFTRLGVPPAEALALGLLARVGLLLPGIAGGILFALGKREARAPATGSRR